MPAVSVVVKAYNHAAYVAQTIQSVLDQSFTDFEIVVTDDASTDGTADIVARFDDPRISLVRHETNRGVSMSMNATLRRTRGEFIAILNSDDFALPGRLEAQVALLRARPELAAAFSLPVEVDEAGNELTGESAIFVRPFADPDTPRAQWLRRFFFHGNCLCAPTAMLRREPYLRAGWYDPRLTNLQDLDMWIRLLERNEIHLMEQRVTAFRLRANDANLSAPRRDTILRSVYESLHIFKRYLAFSPELLRAIFAEEIASGAVVDDRPNLWPAEIALRGGQAWFRLFALDALRDAASTAADFERLRELTGTVNALRLPGLDAPGV